MYSMSINTDRLFILESRIWISYKAYKTRNPDERHLKYADKQSSTGLHHIMIQATRSVERVTCVVHAKHGPHQCWKVREWWLLTLLTLSNVGLLETVIVASLHYLQLRFYDNLKKSIMGIIPRVFLFRRIDLFVQKVIHPTLLESWLPFHRTTARP